jgi:hypothetical protein
VHVREFGQVDRFELLEESSLLLGGASVEEAEDMTLPGRVETGTEVCGTVCKVCCIGHGGFD